MRVAEETGKRQVLHGGWPVVLFRDDVVNLKGNARGVCWELAVFAPASRPLPNGLSQAGIQFSSGCGQAFQGETGLGLEQFEGAACAAVVL